MKKVTFIFGILSVLIFSAYYQYAFNNFPVIRPIYSDITNYFIYLSLSFAFFSLGMHENNRVKLLVYYSIAEFWLFLSLTYIMNDIFDISVVMHKVVFAIFLTFSTSIIWYFVKS